MGWEDVLADLEAQFDAARSVELADDIDARRRLELGSLELADRLRPLLGSPVLVSVQPAGGHAALAGRLGGLGPDWLLLAGVPGEVLLHLGSVLWVDGVGARVTVEQVSPVSARLDLRHALRALLRERAGLTVLLREGGTCAGTLDAVGRDHLLLSLHDAGEQRRPAHVRGVRALPLTAVVGVRRWG